MNTIKKRRSFEADHFRKFLIVVDETPEVDTALYYAASRMQRSSGTMVMLYVIVPQEFQHWINVRQQQVEEETAKAKALFRLMRRKLNNAGYESVACEEIIREGIERRGDPQAHRRGRGHRGAGAGCVGGGLGPRSVGLVPGGGKRDGQFSDPNNHRARLTGPGGSPQPGLKGRKGSRNPAPDRTILELF